MGEDVEMKDYQERGGEGEIRVSEWEDGLPNTDDITPLSQVLISPELASAFSITLEPGRTTIDANQASQSTISSLQKQSLAFSANHFKFLPSFGEIQGRSRDSVVVEEDDEVERQADERDNEQKIRNERVMGSDKRKSQVVENQEPPEESNSSDGQSARALKRARLVWTPQLHKRFVDVVAHLGIRNAVPKTIMQLMNVEGLTRENVASHLQKYRLYVTRMQGLSNEGPSPSDHIFASTPVPPSLKESSGAVAAAPLVAMPMPMPYGHPIMPMPVTGVAHCSNQMNMPSGHPSSPAMYLGFNPHHYNIYLEQQRNWSGNKFGSIASHHQISPK